MQRTVTILAPPLFPSARPNCAWRMTMASWFRLTYQLPGTSSCFNQLSMRFTIPSSLIFKESFSLFRGRLAHLSRLAWPSLSPWIFAENTALGQKGQAVREDPAPCLHESDQERTRRLRKSPAVRRGRDLRWPDETCPRSSSLRSEESPVSGKDPVSFVSWAICAIRPRPPGCRRHAR
jgi:hypothetical protein